MAIAAAVMDLLHGAGERRHHRPHLGHGADHGDAGGEPRALEMARDLIAHDLGLLAHLVGERIVGVRGRLVHHHRERRLERMREIADMGARALDDLAVGVDQRVGLARQRRDLDREVAFEPLGRAGADRGEALRDALERRQAEPDLERRDQQQHDRQHARRSTTSARSKLRVSSSISAASPATATRKRPSSPRSMVRSTMRSALVLGSFDIALAGAAGAVGDAAIGEMRQRRSPTASATSAPPARAVSSRVTCQYQPDSGSSNSGSPSDCGKCSAASSGVATSATSVRR